MEHVREGLAELSSDACQRRLWLAGGDPLVSSVEEAFCRTYDDSGLAGVLDTPRAAEMLGLEAVRLLRELDRALAALDRDLEVVDLIDSPAMTTVRSLAGAALDAIGRGDDASRDDDALS